MLVRRAKFLLSFLKDQNTKQLLHFSFSELETPGRIRPKFAQTEPGRIVVLKLETTRIQVLSDEVLSFCCRRRRSRNRYL